MRKILLAAAMALGLTAPIGADAQSAPQKVWTFPSPENALGYCQLSAIAAATSLSSCAGGIPASATLAVISVETAAVRFRDDGVAPTAGVGWPLAIGATWNVTVNPLSNWQAIPQSGTATIDVVFYR